MITANIGEFKAVEIETYCKHCNALYRSEELRSLTPHRGRYGFDIIVHIGKSLFLHCRNEQEIQRELAEKNIPISLREIAFLGKRFIVYLTLAHRDSQEELKHYMELKGGYILHMDGTCEGGSPHLFSCIDAISNIVLGNKKMLTEDSQYIIPLLEDLKRSYGEPVALVHDMGSAILKSVTTVFPGVADYICHFHFLRDLGKDLFNLEYRAIQHHIRSHAVKKSLNNALKKLKKTIDADILLSDNLTDYLKAKNASKVEESIDPVVIGYLIVAWILEYNSISNGLGFPFDRPHLDFYLRMEKAYAVLECLKEKGVMVLPVAKLKLTLADSSLKKEVACMQEKTFIFDELRKAMRIADPKSHQGLNDEGDDDMKTIESEVTKFRSSAKVKKLAENDKSYRNMLKQIDKYWIKLFADPIHIHTPKGIITLRPQRTNNLMEQSFRFLKRDSRRKSGQLSLSKTLCVMLAETPLVKNLANPDYVNILLKGRRDLATKFADIDIQLVHQEERENAQRWGKYPKIMREIFKAPHLPKTMSCLILN